MGTALQKQWKTFVVAATVRSQSRCPAFAKFLDKSETRRANPIGPPGVAGQTYYSMGTEQLGAARPLAPRPTAKR